MLGELARDPRKTYRPAAVTVTSPYVVPVLTHIRTSIATATAASPRSSGASSHSHLCRPSGLHTANETVVGKRKQGRGMCGEAEGVREDGMGRDEEARC